MRIRKRKVPLPLSSLSPIPLSDPLFLNSTGHLAGYERETTAEEFGNAYAPEVLRDITVEKSKDSRAPDIPRNATQTSSSVVVSASPYENEVIMSEEEDPSEALASVRPNVRADAARDAKLSTSRERSSWRSSISLTPTFTALEASYAFMEDVERILELLGARDRIRFYWLIIRSSERQRRGGRHPAKLLRMTTREMSRSNSTRHSWINTSR